MSQPPFTLATSEVQNAGIPPGVDIAAPSAESADVGCASIAHWKPTMPLRGTVEQHLASLQAQQVALEEHQRCLADLHAGLVHELEKQASESDR